MPSIYLYVPYFCDLTFNDNDFFPVEVTITSKGISVVGDFPRFLPPDNSIQTTISLLSKYQKLHPSLEEIVGTPIFPKDGGHALFSFLASSKSIFGASDALLLMHGYYDPVMCLISKTHFYIYRDLERFMDSLITFPLVGANYKG